MAHPLFNFSFFGTPSLNNFWSVGAVEDPPIPYLSLESPPTIPPVFVYVGHSLVDSISQQMTIILPGDQHYQVIVGAPLSWNWDHHDEAVFDARDFSASEPVTDLVLCENNTAAPYTAKPWIEIWRDNALTENPDIRTWWYQCWQTVPSGGTDFATWKTNMAAYVAAHEVQIQQLYLAIGLPNHPKMIPAGAAMLALVEAVEDSLITGITDPADLFTDDVHPDDPGVYFVAMVHYAALTGTSPVGLSNTLGDATVTTTQASELQALAWSVVSTYPFAGIADWPEPPAPTGEITLGTMGTDVVNTTPGTPNYNDCPVDFGTARAGRTLVMFYGGAADGQLGNTCIIDPGGDAISVGNRSRTAASPTAYGSTLWYDAVPSDIAGTVNVRVNTTTETWIRGRFYWMVLDGATDTPKEVLLAKGDFTDQINGDVCFYFASGGLNSGTPLTVTAWNTYGPWDTEVWRGYEEYVEGPGWDGVHTIDGNDPWGLAEATQGFGVMQLLLEPEPAAVGGGSVTVASGVGTAAAVGQEVVGGTDGAATAAGVGAAQATGNKIAGVTAAAAGIGASAVVGQAVGGGGEPVAVAHLAQTNWTSGGNITGTVNIGTQDDTKLIIAAVSIVAGDANITAGTLASVSGTLYENQNHDGINRHIAYVVWEMPTQSGSQSFTITCAANAWFGCVDWFEVLNAEPVPTDTANDISGPVSTTVTAVADGAVINLAQGYSSGDTITFSGTGWTLSSAPTPAGGNTVRSGYNYPAAGSFVTSATFTPNNSGQAQITLAFEPLPGAAGTTDGVAAAAGIGAVAMRTPTLGQAAAAGVGAAAATGNKIAAATAAAIGVGAAAATGNQIDAATAAAAGVGAAAATGNKIAAAAVAAPGIGAVTATGIEIRGVTAAAAGVGAAVATGNQIAAVTASATGVGAAAAISAAGSIASAVGVGVVAAIGSEVRGATAAASGIGAAAATGNKIAAATASAAGTGAITTVASEVRGATIAASGIGSLTARSPTLGQAAAAGIGAAAAISNQIAVTIASAAGVGAAGAASALGSSASAAGVGTVAAVGTEVRGATGAATGTGTLSARTPTLGQAAAAGIGAAQATSIQTAAATGAAAGAGVLNGVSNVAATVSATAAATGVGAIAATGNKIAAATASAAGIGAIVAAGTEVRPATGAASGIGTLSARTLTLGQAAAAGVGTAAATGNQIAAATGAAAGVGAAQATSIQTATATFSAAGTGILNGVSNVAATIAATAAAAGVGTVVATGASIAAATGSAAGLGAANSNGTGVRNSTGAASGLGAVAVTGRATASAVGLSQGFGVAISVPRAIHVVVGAATGVSIVIAVSDQPPLLASPNSRSFTVLAEDRLATVKAPDRVEVIDAEQRSFTVAA